MLREIPPAAESPEQFDAVLFNLDGGMKINFFLPKTVVALFCALSLQIMDPKQNHGLMSW